MSDHACECRDVTHGCRLIALTGGPGGGKTAVLEIVRRAFCEHVVVLPEAATVLFRGGFPRHDTDPGRRATQEAIFRVQRAMEMIVIGEARAAIALCDRGTVDGLAYWPDGAGSACASLGIDRAEELERYGAVIHLRTPRADRGYDHANPQRVEEASDALALDRRIEAAWSGHRSRVFIESEGDFLEKVAKAIAAIRAQVPECCRAHRVPEVDDRAASSPA